MAYHPRNPRYNLWWLLAIILLVVLLVGILNGNVLAQEVVDTTVDLDPFIADLVPYVFLLLATIGTAAISWVAKKIHDRTGVDIAAKYMEMEAKHREAFQSALMNGARAIVTRYTPKDLELDVKHPAIKEGVEFVLGSVPDAIDYFDLSAEDIEKHLKPKLGLAAAEITVSTPTKVIATTTKVTKPKSSK